AGLQAMGRMISLFGPFSITATLGSDGLGSGFGLGFVFGQITTATPAAMASRTTPVAATAQERVFFSSVGSGAVALPRQAALPRGPVVAPGWSGGVRPLFRASEWA